MATDYLSALNIGSGLNTTEIVDAIVEAERAPRANIIEQAKEERTVAISSFGKVKQNFETFGTELSKLDGKTGLSTTQVGTSIGLEITDSAKAKAFSNNITVSTLAAAHTLAFNNHASETASIGTGTLTFSFGKWNSDNTFTANSSRTDKAVTISTANNTLAGLRDAINAAAMDVTASILKTGTSTFSLVVRSKEGASQAMKITAVETSDVSGLSNLAYATVNTGVRTVDGADAALTIDGVAVTRESNTIADLVDGMTLTLKSTTSSAETIGATYSTTTAQATMQTFVDQLSNLGKTLDDLSARGINGAESGALAGDPLVRLLRGQLRSYTTSPIVGFGAKSYYLADYGVKTNQDGTLTLDAKKFKKQYEADPAGFSAIINSRVTTNSGLVTGSVSGTTYKAGTYAFDINDSGAATIAGTAMTRTDNTFTVSSGDAAGVRIDITGSGADANIYVGRSILDSLRNFSTKLVSSTGEIAIKIRDFEENSADYTDQLAALDKSIARTRARYTTQFVNMEKAIAGLNDTKAGLENMMEAWKGSMK